MVFGQSIDTRFDLTLVNGVRTITYQHPNDGVSSSNWNLMGLNAGSTVGEIPSAENIIRNLMGSNSDNPGVPAEGTGGNRSGHNVTDNDKFIFDIPANQEGGVRKRKDE